MLTEVEFSDAELVGRARSGDQWAFSVLFDRHRASVVAVCRGGVRSAVDVDDAVQEAFARALGKLHHLRDAEQFGRWVRAIAIRVCIDHHRTAHRVVTLDTDHHGEVEDLAPFPDEVVEAAEDAVAIRATVHSYLNELGSRDRHALWLRHVREAPVSTVASELGMTEGSTRVMLSRARKRLRAAATGVGVLVPSSWRQWFRNHVHAPVPAFDAIAMVVAFTIAGGVSGAAQIRQPEPHEPSRDVSVQRRAEGPQHSTKPAAVQPRRVRQPQRLDPIGSPAPPAKTRARPSSVAAPVQPPRGNAIQPARDSVNVTRQYPDEDETDELVDVTVLVDEHENTLRLYGNEVAPVVKPAVDATDGVIGPTAESSAP